MRPVLSLLALLVMPLAIAAGPRANVETEQTRDSDGARSHIYMVGYEQPVMLTALPGKWSVAAGGRDYLAPAGEERFTALRARYEQALTSTTGLVLGARQLWSSGWSPTLAALTLNQRIGDAWALEFSAERDLVDTVVAIRAKNLIDSYSASADYRLTGEWTLVGAGSYQHLGDGNERVGRILRLVYSPAAAGWFNTQLRARRVDSNFPGTGYFSPRRLEEITLSARAGMPVFGDRFALSLEAGGGVQTIDNADSHPLYRAELRGRGWFSDSYGLEGKLGCSNAGNLNGDSANNGYRYCYGDLSFLIAW